MIGDILSSSHEYIKSRLVNPFLGTFIFVWIVRNWLLVYSLFTFDESFKWKHKIEFIKNYFYKKDAVHEILKNLEITTYLFLATLLVLLFTRWVTNIYEYRLLPLTYKFSDSKQLVTKERYEQLAALSLEKDNTIERLRNLLDRTEHILINKDEEIENLESKLTELQIQINNESNKAGTIESLFEIPKYDQNFSNKVESYILENNLNVETKSLIIDGIHKLYSDKKVEEFLILAGFILKPTPDVKSVYVNTMRYYSDLYLIKDQGRRSITLGVTNLTGYDLTEVGNHVYIILNS